MNNESIDKEEIKKQAKEILDRFAKELGKVSEKGDFSIEREEFERSEGDGVECKDFKEKLLDNAPKKNSDFVLAEKGSWKR